jgi:hypothetical protein
MTVIRFPAQPRDETVNRAAIGSVKVSRRTMNAVSDQNGQHEVMLAGDHGIDGERARRALSRLQ